MEIEKSGKFAYIESKPFKGLGQSKSKYPFAEMEEGDSVFYPGQINGGPAHSAATKAKSRHGINLATKMMDGGLRIWRLADQ